MYRDSEKPYEYRAANNTFEESLAPGKDNSGKFRKLEANERPMIGDIGIWVGYHMVIHAGFSNGAEDIFTTSSSRNRLVEMRLNNMVVFFNKKQGVPHVVWFRPQF
jgi:hypothetical protein